MDSQLHNWWTLRPLAKLEDWSLVAMRWVTGVFIADGVWDNVTNAERMTEFITFLNANGFSQPHFWAPFSVYSQLLVAILFFIGLLTRWAGLILATTFVVAIAMVHLDQTLREQWPALALVIIGLLLASRGGGQFSLDFLIEQNKSVSSPDI